MVEAYQIKDQEKPCFLTFQVVGWADVLKCQKLCQIRRFNSHGLLVISSISQLQIANDRWVFCKQRPVAGKIWKNWRGMNSK